MLYRNLDSGESCRVLRVAVDIIDATPWTARLVRNNHLRQHCHLLARTFRYAQPATDLLRPACRRLVMVILERSQLFTEHHPLEFPLVPLLVRVAAYAGQWLREPESWVPPLEGKSREIIRSLLEHLFTRWPMPDYFDAAWLVKGSLRLLERDWYCHLGAGGSFKTLAEIPPSITARALHLARAAPANLTIREALRWGQVKAAGGSDQLLVEVLASRMVRDLSNDEIWSRLIEKLSATPNFKAKHFGVIADTLLEVIAKEGSERAAVLVNLPLPELLSHCRRSWYVILKIVKSYQSVWQRTDICCANLRVELLRQYSENWPRMLGAKPFVGVCDQGGFCCQIVELTHLWQLVAESKMMRHCVDSYAGKCKLGKSAIFSLRTVEVPVGNQVPTSHLTIEVDRRSRRIIQVRGRWNDAFIPSRIPLLQKWALEMKLLF